MSLLTLTALAVTLAQQAAVPQSAVISGTVLEAGSNAPVAGAQVSLIFFSPAPQPGRPPEPLVATTDRNGRYRFEALEPGRYRITVYKAGFATTLGAALPEATLTTGERKTDVNVTIQRGATIVGRVLDENGEPIANANVLALRRPLQNGAAMPARLGLIPAGSSAQTNDLGEFRLFGLAPGDVFVQATSHGDFGRSASPRPTVSLPTYFPGTADVVGAMPIALAAGQTSGDITIRMVSAPAFQVSGVVTDEGGRPVENALVRLLLETAPGQPFMPGFMGRMMSAHSDKAGKFTLDGVVNGTYTLLAIAPVLLSTGDASRGGGGGVGGSMSFASGVVAGGVVSGFVGGGVITETVNGVTTQYRDDAGTRMTVTVTDANLVGVGAVVRTAAK